MAWLLVASHAVRPAVLLVDNGSRRPASTLALRRTASALSHILHGDEVLPVSLQFSDAIPAVKLEGLPARLLREELSMLAQRGDPRAVIVPLFLGPSGTFARGLQNCIEELDASGANLQVHVGPSLVDQAQPEDKRVGRTLATLVEKVSDAQGLSGPLKVVVVDHGTPSPEVNAVRMRLTSEVGELLGTRAAAVAAASMERPEGEAYDFNEPLLEDLLATQPFNTGDVIVAMAFLLPGKHAGAGGDIAQIIARACDRTPGLRVHTTPLLASQPLLHEVLRDRVLQALSSSGLRGSCSNQTL